MNVASPRLINVSVLVNVLRARALAFFFVFFLVFTISYLVLTAFGAVPGVAPVALVEDEASAVATTTIVAVVEPVAPDTSSSAPAMSNESALPRTIIIDKLNRTLPVLNPESRTIADLDQALLSGVVRHPDSATFAQEGTMFILGHSSYLPSVHNQFFQAFNGLQNLEWGDTIRVRSSDTEYVYQVERVYKAKAEDVEVSIAHTGARLFLATCNSFGSKDDRYIVEAKLLYSEPL